MDVYQAIVTKRNTRSFAPGPVPDLHKVLQAGRMAGSAKKESGKNCGRAVAAVVVPVW